MRGGSRSFKVMFYERRRRGSREAVTGGFRIPARARSRDRVIVSCDVLNAKTQRRRTVRETFSFFDGARPQEGYAQGGAGPGLGVSVQMGFGGLGPGVRPVGPIFCQSVNLALKQARTEILFRPSPHGNGPRG